MFLLRDWNFSSKIHCSNRINRTTRYSSPITTLSALVAAHGRPLSHRPGYRHIFRIVVSSRERFHQISIISSRCRDEIWRNQSGYSVYLDTKFLAHLFLVSQTEHDFNLEKQTLVHEAKLNIQEEFAKKEKDREIQERITRSAEIGECRVKKMQIRDGLLNTLIAEAGAKCAVVARGNNYPQLLQKLIVQGLIKIEENEVVIYCRSEDVPLVEKVLPAAIKEYVEIIERESSVKLTPAVTLNPDRTKDLNESSYGGVMLTAINGKIVCDNTMSSRLALVYEELLPSIRAILFPEEQ